ncbi:MAG: BLUF domain-containing protein [Aquamicrobium sp.]|uniref:BLUF domain-containing protein n=1 Tax=Aquamicrobium sp. TaxID=1872579 RepID=UPI00349E8622|nr:BLUF domain-containing protein [Aquamicrobium sp.]
MPLRIVYVSTLAPDVSEDDIAALVDKAAAFNRAHGITGVLALEDRRMCQILEGPDAAVAALFRSIGRDPRHSGVTEIVNVPINAVTFEDWGMVRRRMIDMVVSAFALG